MYTNIFSSKSGQKKFRRIFLSCDVRNIQKRLPVIPENSEFQSQRICGLALILMNFFFKYVSKYSRRNILITKNITNIINPFLEIALVLYEMLRIIWKIGSARSSPSPTLITRMVTERELAFSGFWAIRALQNYSLCRNIPRKLKEKIILKIPASVAYFVWDKKRKYF